MDRRASFALLGLAMMSAAWGQNLQLPDNASRNEEALTRSFADFARRASSGEGGPDQDASAKFLLQLASGSYEDAVATATAKRQQMRAGSAPEPFIRLELYARAKAAEARGADPESAFRKSFAELIVPMDDRAAFLTEHFLKALVWVFQRRFDQVLARYQDRRELAPAEAVELMDGYYSVQALKYVAPWLDDAIAANDAQRYVINTDVLIKTREGVTLSAVVVRKKNVAGTLPTSLSFDIYTDLDNWLDQAKTAAIHGYAGVVADPRGKRLSRDEIAPWEHEARDTYEVIDWISKQPWSNGAVGMYGVSYAGFTQWAAAKSLHPSLKTIVPAASSFPGFGAPMQNNVVQFVQYAWPFWVMNNRTLDNATYNDFVRWNSLKDKWFASGRPFREIDAIDGTPNKLLQRQLLHPSLDKYWQDMQAYGKDYARISIPVLTLTGYYDDANAAAVRNLLDHYEYNRQANHYLVIGPYDHGGTLQAFKSPVLMGYEIDPVAQIDSIELTYQWFDHVMRGAPMPELVKDRINYEVMGANVWQHASSIQAMSAKTLTLYLTDDNAGARYRLSSSKPSKTGFIPQIVDFADRTSQGNLYDPAPLSSDEPLNNGVAFVSEPFEASVTVSGLITGELEAAINKRDVDFTMAVYELMPDGRRFHLSYYLGRASYSHDMTIRKLLTPGKRTSIPFERTPLISRRMSPGSRLLVLLTVNKNAYAQVNYGTGKDVSDESIADAKEPLQVKWYNDSFVKVPITLSSP